jgi:hypothetical protein
MKNIKKIPVCVIGTFGHCGLDWLHSLLDSHKDVLIVPPLSFFRKINFLKNKKIYLNSYLNQKIVINIITNLLFKKTSIESYKILKKNQKKSLFKKYMNDFFKMEKDLNMEKKIFFSIYYAFAKINKININKIKIIVANEANAWNCNKYIKYFNSKFVFLIRDPRATIAGSLRVFKRHKKIPVNFKIDINLSRMISAQKFCQKVKENKILILKNENMHNNLRMEMKKLSKYLGIQFNNSLLKPTFLGKKWIGESGYLSKIDLIKPYPQNYYVQKNIEKRWRDFLNKNTILIIETIFEKLMIKYKYKFDNQLNLKLRFFGYLSLLFRFNESKNTFSSAIGFIKNIIRRNFIILTPSLSRKIFNIL